MKFLTRQQIQLNFDRVATTLDELSPHMRLARHPTRDADSYDYATLLTMGPEAIIAPMERLQPKAHAALIALNPELLVCELTSTGQSRMQTWTNDAFLGSGERYFRISANFRDDSIASAGEKSVYWFRYMSLPPEISKAYYWHSKGMEVIHELPSNPHQSRGLPAKLDVWLHADQVGRWSKKQLDEIKVSLEAVADKDVAPRKDGLVWKSFACVLDSREQDADDNTGDLLFVQERSSSQRVFHVHDGNFGAIRQVVDPVKLFDEYVAWVFSGGSGRFDFRAYSA